MKNHIYSTTAKITEELKVCICDMLEQMIC